MNAIARQILADALSLSETERADLAAELIDSLEEHEDVDVATAWSDEIARRIQELDDGSVSAVPWAEARRIIMGQTDGPGNG